MESVYYGQIKCTGSYKNGEPCKNNSYYYSDGSYFCGIHSNKLTRIQLIKNKEAKKERLEIKYESHRNDVKLSQIINLISNKKGVVMCTKMLMMKEVPLIKDFMNVFPNFKHQNRTDGFGCSSLSPMSMGPIIHNQPGLPECKNLENFHQGNKCFESEVTDNKPNELFYMNQIKMYNDSIPHRHKSTSGNKNQPLFSVWRDRNGNEKYFSYIESRQFYCNYYERFALKDKNFHYLVELLNKGYNLNICGYDAYQPNKSIEEHYLDSSKPFGHELVLYTLLMYKEDQYPWRKYKTEDF